MKKLLRRMGVSSNSGRPQHSPIVAMYWSQIGAYHADRCIAAVAALGDEAKVLAVETSETSHTYAWERVEDAEAYETMTLVPNQKAESVGHTREFLTLSAILLKRGVSHVFFSGYERPAVFLVACLCRISGIKAFVFLDSKFDDKRRFVPLELFKAALMLPYRGAFASGPATASYLAFLGFRRRPVVTGYDTVSLARMRELAKDDEGTPWLERPFLIVSRLVEKKNVALALHAFSKFQAARTGSRKLIICGSGPLEGELRELSKALEIEGCVEFRGFCSQVQVAKAMKSALCLLLPSTEEQWGLVINEALAFDLPVLVSSVVGASETLVHPFVNGYILSPHHPDQWSSAMSDLDRSEAEWERLRKGARQLAPKGDVQEFSRSLIRLIDSR